MSTNRTVAVAALVVAAAACASPAGRPERTMPARVVAPWDTIAIADGRGVIRRMRARYDGRFPTSVVFRQENTLYPTSGGEQKSEWLEYAAIPGRLRVEYLPAANRNGVIFANQRINVFEGGRSTRSERYIHPLMVLLYDIHALPADSTITLVDSLRFDLAKVRQDSWLGRRVFVIGAVSGDTASNQFWVDAERLVTVRVIQSEKRGSRTVLSETRMDNFVEYGESPLATEILFLRDGRASFREVYRDVRVNEALPEELFDPARWTQTGVFRRD